MQRAQEMTGENVANEGSSPTAPKSAILLNHLSILLSFAGLFVAGVLSLGHLLARSIPCGETGGCDIVTSNPASMIAGVPIAYLGFGSYVVLAVLSTIRGLRGLGRTRPLGMVCLAITGLGALYSFYLQFISFTQIHAICYWCLASAIIMSLLFLLQAALAQAEIPNDARRTGDGGLVLAFSLTLLVAIGLGYQAFELSKSAPPRTIGMGREDVVKLLLTPDSMKLGPDTATVKIVEFSDLLCPSCRAAYPDVKKIVQEANGTVQLILRHRPLAKNASHQMATPAAFFAEYAAEKGDGWKFVDEMYSHDISEVQSMGELLEICKKVGIDVKDAQSRMNTADPLWKRVMRDLDAAEQLDVSETPTFVIFAPGHIPAMASGRELVRTIKRPEYQQLIYPNGK